MKTLMINIVSGLMNIFPKKNIKEIRDRNGKLYFRRNLYLQTKWFSICEHEFFQDRNDPTYDKDVDLHNHPRSFWSLIVSGGYVETFILNKDDSPPKDITHRPGTFFFVDLKRFHRVKYLISTYCRTLIISKNENVPWGFLVNGKVIPNDEYRILKNNTN
jgi:hypothetical protein